MSGSVKEAQGVWVTFSLVGFHRWPDAPAGRAYLRQKHRHLFRFRVQVATKKDRSVEFHDLLDVCHERLGAADNENGDPLDFDEQSCESIADDLAKLLVARYKAPVSVTVSEDGECGATTRWRP